MRKIENIYATKIYRIIPNNNNNFKNLLEAIFNVNYMDIGLN